MPASLLRAVLRGSHVPGTLSLALQSAVSIPAPMAGLPLHPLHVLRLICGLMPPALPGAVLRLTTITASSGPKSRGFLRLGLHPKGKHSLLPQCLPMCCPQKPSSEWGKKSTLVVTLATCIRGKLKAPSPH